MPFMVTLAEKSWTVIRLNLNISRAGLIGPKKRIINLTLTVPASHTKNQVTDPLYHIVIPVSANSGSIMSSVAVRLLKKWDASWDQNVCTISGSRMDRKI